MYKLLAASWHLYRDTSLIAKMTAGFVLGLAAAFGLGSHASFLAPLGSIFLHLLKMIVIPVIMLTLIEALANTHTGSVARIAVKAFCYYIFTTLAAVLIGLVGGLLVNPGNGLNLPQAHLSSPQPPTLSDQLLSIFPTNIVAAMSDGNILALIFVALIVGATLAGMQGSHDATVADYGRSLTKLILAAKVATFRILDGILQYAPIGVFALVATQIGGQGGAALIALAKLTGVLYAGLAAQIALVYAPLLLVSGVSIGGFFTHCRDALLTAFTTQSSSGTIPVSLKAAHRAGLMERVSGFVIPIGATVNMDGAVIRYGASVILAANIVGHSFTLPELIMLVLTATLVSIGTAGVPGAGLIGLSILLAQADLPLDVVALIAGVDVVLGMGATMVNVTGDLVGAHIIDRSERRRAARRASEPTPR